MVDLKHYTLPDGTTVANGLWIAAGHGRAIGTKNVQWASETSLLARTSPNPFGLILERGTHSELISARQIVAGQLGPYPYVPRLKVAREAREGLRHKPAEWVQLRHLAAKAERSSQSILMDFWDFVPRPSRSAEAFINVQFCGHSQIHNQLPHPPIQLTRKVVKDTLDEESWRSLYLPHAFAVTVLRLSGFYQLAYLERIARPQAA